MAAADWKPDDGSVLLLPHPLSRNVMGIFFDRFFSIGWDQFHTFLDRTGKKDHPVQTTKIYKILCKYEIILAHIFFLDPVWLPLELVSKI